MSSTGLNTNKYRQFCNHNFKNDNTEPLHLQIFHPNAVNVTVRTKNHLLQAQKMARHNMQYTEEFITNKFSLNIFYQSALPSTQKLKHVLLYIKGVYAIHLLGVINAEVTGISHLCLLNHANGKQQTLVNMLSTSY
jgi:hypothetical protein